MEVDKTTNNVRKLTTTVRVEGTDERNPDELGAVCKLGLDGIRCVSFLRSIRNDMEGSDSEGVWRLDSPSVPTLQALRSKPARFSELGRGWGLCQ